MVQGLKLVISFAEDQGGSGKTLTGNRLLYRSGYSGRTGFNGFGPADYCRPHDRLLVQPGRQWFSSGTQTKIA